MLIALLIDIHGNREAFEACLAHARRHAIDRYVFLGDLVGYGADPRFVIATVKDYVASGAIALRGNHDNAALGVAERMNEVGQAAIEWTRTQLDDSERDFLFGLPFSVNDGSRLYVHASAADPEDWDYVFDEPSAARSLRATDATLTFCGHTHLPALFHMTTAGHVALFEPRADVAVTLTPLRRWVAVIGSVGQPRDRNPAACYALYDDATLTLTYVRVPYDIEIAQQKIRDAGLPPFLADRLAWGR